MTNRPPPSEDGDGNNAGVDNDDYLSRVIAAMESGVLDEEYIREMKDLARYVVPEAINRGDTYGEIEKGSVALPNHPVDSFGVSTIHPADGDGNNNRVDNVDNLSTVIAATVTGVVEEDFISEMRNLARYVVPEAVSLPNHPVDSLGVSIRDPVQSGHQIDVVDDGGNGGRTSKDRKRVIPWSEEEHKLFLYGMSKYGKGDWRNISRYAVPSRTPTQVASHAQKFFLRQQIRGRKERKRSSIHDITTVSDISELETLQNTLSARQAHGLQQMPSRVPSQLLHDEVLKWETQLQNLGAPVGQVHLQGGQGQLHDQGAPGQLHIEEAPGQLHIEEAPGQLLLRGTPTQLHDQGAPGQLHIQEAPGQLLHQGAPSQLHYQGAPRPMHHQGAPRPMHLQRAQSQLNIQGATRQLHHQIAPSQMHLQRAQRRQMHLQRAQRSQMQLQGVPNQRHLPIAQWQLHNQGAPSQLHNQFAPSQLHNQGTPT